MTALLDQGPPEAPFAFGPNNELIKPWGRAVLRDVFFFVHQWSNRLRYDETRDLLYRQLAQQGIRLVDLARVFNEKGDRRTLYVSEVPNHELTKRDRERLTSWADCCGYTHIGFGIKEPLIKLSGKVGFPKDASVTCQSCNWEYPYSYPQTKTVVGYWGRLPNICVLCGAKFLPQWEAR